jgi:hypothetical protein
MGAKNSNTAARLPVVKTWVLILILLYGTVVIENGKALHLSAEPKPKLSIAALSLTITWVLSVVVLGWTGRSASVCFIVLEVSLFRPSRLRRCGALPDLSANSAVGETRCFLTTPESVRMLNGVSLCNSRWNPQFWLTCNSLKQRGFRAVAEPVFLRNFDL